MEIPAFSSPCFWRAARRFTAAGLSAVYLFTNAAFAHSAESNFWSERKKSSARFRAETGAEHDLAAPRPLAAAADQRERQLLAQLPGAARMDVAAPAAAVKTETFSLGEGLSAGSSAKNLPTWLSDLVQPYGAIRDVRISPRAGAPLIIHLQDIHDVEEAQRNLSALIETFKENRGVNLVGLEGAQGAFALDGFHAFPDQDIIRGVADYFLKQGYIGGPEYAGMTAAQPPLLWGVENVASYTRNLLSVKDAARMRPAFDKVLVEWRDAADELKNRLYSPALKEFDGHASRYDKRQESLGTYVRYLMSADKGDTAGFTNARMLLNALDWEEILDFKAVEKDRAALVERMARRIPEKDLNALIQESWLYRTGRKSYSAYYGALLALCKADGISLDDFSQLSAYISYVMLVEKINRNDLLSEIARLEEETEGYLAKTPAQRDMVKISRQLVLLGKLGQHSLTPADWARYVRQKLEIGQVGARLTRLGESLGDKYPLPALDETVLTPFEQFCFLALERNKALVGNLLEKMSADKRPIAVLVAGGFHTDGITQILRQSDASYVVIAPRISSLPEGAQKKSLDVIARDPTPVEKLFAGEIINILGQRAFSPGMEAGPREKTILALAVALCAGLGLLLGIQADPLPFHQIEWARVTDATLTGGAAGLLLTILWRGGRKAALRVSVKKAVSKEPAAAGGETAVPIDVKGTAYRIDVAGEKPGLWGRLWAEMPHFKPASLIRTKDLTYLLVWVHWEVFFHIPVLNVFFYQYFAGFDENKRQEMKESIFLRKLLHFQEWPENVVQDVPWAKTRLWFGAACLFLACFFTGDPWIFWIFILTWAWHTAVVVARAHPELYVKGEQGYARAEYLAILAAEFAMGLALILPVVLYLVGMPGFPESSWLKSAFEWPLGENKSLYTAVWNGLVHFILVHSVVNGILAAFDWRPASFASRRGVPWRGLFKQEPLAAMDAGQRMIEGLKERRDKDGMVAAHEFFEKVAAMPDDPMTVRNDPKGARAQAVRDATAVFGEDFRNKNIAQYRETAARLDRKLTAAYAVVLLEEQRFRLEEALVYLGSSPLLISPFQQLESRYRYSASNQKFLGPGSLLRSEFFTRLEFVLARWTTEAASNAQELREKAEREKDGIGLMIAALNRRPLHQPFQLVDWDADKLAAAAPSATVEISDVARVNSAIVDIFKDQPGKSLLHDDLLWELVGRVALPRKAIEGILQAGQFPVNVDESQGLRRYFFDPAMAQRGLGGTYGHLKPRGPGGKLNLHWTTALLSSLIAICAVLLGDPATMGAIFSLKISSFGFAAAAPLTAINPDLAWTTTEWSAWIFSWTLLVFTGAIFVAGISGWWKKSRLTAYAKGQIAGQAASLAPSEQRALLGVVDEGIKAGWDDSKIRSEFDRRLEATAGQDPWRSSEEAKADFLAQLKENDLSGVYQVIGDGDSVSLVNKGINKHALGVIRYAPNRDVIFSNGSVFRELRVKLAEFAGSEGGVVYAGAGGDEFSILFQAGTDDVPGRLKRIVEAYNGHFQRRFAFFKLQPQDPNEDLEAFFRETLSKIPGATTLVRHGTGYMAVFEQDIPSDGRRLESGLSNKIGHWNADRPPTSQNIVQITNLNAYLEKPDRGPFTISVGGVRADQGLDVLEKLSKVKGEEWLRQRPEELSVWLGRMANDMQVKVKGAGKNNAYVPESGDLLAKNLKVHSITPEAAENLRQTLRSANRGSSVGIDSLTGLPLMSRFRQTVAGSAHKYHYAVDVTRYLPEQNPVNGVGADITSRAFHKYQEKHGYEGGNAAIRALAKIVRDVFHIPFPADAAAGSPAATRAPPDGFVIASNEDIRGPPSTDNGIGRIAAELKKALPGTDPHIVVYKVSDEDLRNLQVYLHKEGSVTADEAIDIMGHVEWLFEMKRKNIDHAATLGMDFRELAGQLGAYCNITPIDGGMLIELDTTDPKKLDALFSDFREAQDEESWRSLRQFSEERKLHARPAKIATSGFSIPPIFQSFLFNVFAWTAHRAFRVPLNAIKRSGDALLIRSILVPAVEIFLLPGIAPFFMNSVSFWFLAFGGAFVAALAHGVPWGWRPPPDGQRRWFAQSFPQFFARLAASYVIILFSLLAAQTPDANVLALSPWLHLTEGTFWARFADALLPAVAGHGVYNALQRDARYRLSLNGGGDKAPRVKLRDDLEGHRDVIEQAYVKAREALSEKKRDLLEQSLDKILPKLEERLPRSDFQDGRSILIHAVERAARVAEWQGDEISILSALLSDVKPGVSWKDITEENYKGFLRREFGLTYAVSAAVAQRILRTYYARGAEYKPDEISMASARNQMGLVAQRLGDKQPDEVLRVLWALKLDDLARLRPGRERRWDEQRAKDWDKLNLVRVSLGGQLYISKDDFCNVPVLTQEQEDLYSEIFYVHAPMAERLGQGLWATQLRDLSMKITDPALYRVADQLFHEATGLHHTDANDEVQAYRKDMEDALSKKHPGLQVRGRVKGLHSFWEKMRLDKKVAAEVNDLIGFMVVSPGTRDVSEEVRAYQLSHLGPELAQKTEVKTGHLGTYSYFRVVNAPNLPLRPEPGAAAVKCAVETQILPKPAYQEYIRGESAHWIYDLYKRLGNDRAPVGRVMLTGNFSKDVEGFIAVRKKSAYVAVEKDGRYIPLALSADATPADAAAHVWVDLLRGDYGGMEEISVNRSESGRAPTERLPVRRGALLRLITQKKALMSINLLTQIWAKSTRPRTRLMALRAGRPEKGLVKRGRDSVLDRRTTLGKGPGDLEANNFVLAGYALELGLTKENEGDPSELFAWLGTFDEGQELYRQLAVIDGHLGVDRLQAMGHPVGAGGEYYVNVGVRNDRPGLIVDLGRIFSKYGFKIEVTGEGGPLPAVPQSIFFSLKHGSGSLGDAGADFQKAMADIKHMPDVSPAPVADQIRLYPRDISITLAAKETLATDIAECFTDLNIVSLNYPKVEAGQPVTVKLTVMAPLYSDFAEQRELQIREVLSAKYGEEIKVSVGVPIPEEPPQSVLKSLFGEFDPRDLIPALESRARENNGETGQIRKVLGWFLPPVAIVRLTRRGLEAVFQAAGFALTSEHAEDRSLVRDAIRELDLGREISMENVHIVTGELPAGGELVNRLVTFVWENGALHIYLHDAVLKAWRDKETKRVEGFEKTGYSYARYVSNALAVMLYHELAEARGLSHGQLVAHGLDLDGLDALYQSGMFFDDIRRIVRLRGEMALGESFEIQAKGREVAVWPETAGTGAVAKAYEAVSVLAPGPLRPLSFEITLGDRVKEINVNRGERKKYLDALVRRLLADNGQTEANQSDDQWTLGLTRRILAGATEQNILEALAGTGQADGSPVIRDASTLAGVILRRILRLLQEGVFVSEAGSFVKDTERLLALLNAMGGSLSEGRVDRVYRGTDLPAHLRTPYQLLDMELLHAAALEAYMPPGLTQEMEEIAARLDETARDSYDAVRRPSVALMPIRDAAAEAVQRGEGDIIVQLSALMLTNHGGILPPEERSQMELIKRLDKELHGNQAWALSGRRVIFEVHDDKVTGLDVENALGTLRAIAGNPLPGLSGSHAEFIWKLNNDDWLGSEGRVTVVRAVSLVQGIYLKLGVKPPRSLTIFAMERADERWDMQGLEDIVVRLIKVLAGDMVKDVGAGIRKEEERFLAVRRAA